MPNTVKNDKAVDLAPIEDRAKKISDWLKKNGRGCFDEQKHLDPGTQERIYWHYGYMVALRDMYRYLTGEPLASREHRTLRPDKHNESPAA